MDFQDEEIRDGFRMTWNTVPGEQEEIAKQLVVPLACLYTPMKQTECPPRLDYSPVYCSCGAILSHNCQIIQ